MQGLGNDFVMLDAWSQVWTLTEAQIQHLADRHFGIGCDQVLLLAPPQNDCADVWYRIFNADGSEVMQCGNGARCVARYLNTYHGLTKQPIIAETGEGFLELYLEADEQIRVNMGSPHFAPTDIPVTGEIPLDKRYTIAEETWQIETLSIGNPHAILSVPSVQQAQVQSLGPAVQALPCFTAGVNVGFMEICTPNYIRLRTYERGAGETLACGSNACAAVVSGIQQQQLRDPVTVSLAGGDLLVSWQGDNSPVWMTGPAEIVFTGEIIL